MIKTDDHPTYDRDAECDVALERISQHLKDLTPFLACAGCGQDDPDDLGLLGAQGDWWCRACVPEGGSGV